ncbi:MAG: RNA polymerase sigma factor [Candidatus Omnitrophota bacterium]|nr:RNA polymerase sigma factor [Candidatus Omnitrophota bacterium]
MPDESGIIRAVLDGQPDRYAELVDRYQGRAIRLAFSLLGNDDDARETSQEAFLKAYRSLGRFRGEAAFSTWLFRIVINECRSRWRRRAREPVATARIGGSPAADEESEGSLFVDPEDPGADPAEQLAQRELARRLSREIARLPMQQRIAFVSHHLHGCSLEETAAVMRRRVGTVKSHLFRATERLRRTLGPWLTQEQQE